MEENNDLKFDAKDVEDNKVFAMLSYIGILVLVPLLARPDSKFAKAHAKQGLVMFIAGVAISFVAWIPLFGWALAMAILIVDIIALVNALQGKFWKIPFAYDLSVKFNL